MALAVHVMIFEELAHPESILIPCSNVHWKLLISYFSSSCS